MVNHIIVSGRISEFLELKKTSKGTNYTKFIVAHNNLFSKKTELIPVIAWTKTAESLVYQQTKGSLIFITGSLNYNTTINDGIALTYFNILANKISCPENIEKKAVPDKKTDQKVAKDIN